MANHQEITIATWINWSGGGNWQRIFDFGNGTQENMFLTTNNNSGQLQFSIVNDGLTVDLTGPELPQNVWKHVAITINTTGTRMYLDGALVAENTQGTINPLLFKPVQNYIGRSQYPDPMLQASLNDFKIPETENHLIIEGAGGLMVPLNRKDCIIDLIEGIDAEVVLVSRNYLGSINHTLLSVEAIVSRGISIKGIIFNDVENVDTESVIIEMTGLKYLGRVEMEVDLTQEVISNYASKFRAVL